jgi:hypothetical protein
MENYVIVVFLIVFSAMSVLKRLNAGSWPAWTHEVFMYLAFSATFSFAIREVLDRTFFDLHWTEMVVLAIVLIVIPAAIISGLYQLLQETKRPTEKDKS